MAEVTVYDAERMKAIEDASVVNGEIDPVTGHLMLTRFDESVIDAGLVVTGMRIVTSTTRPVTGLYEGLEIYETDTNRKYIYDGTNWIENGRGVIVCTSSTRPTTGLVEGLRIYETDTFMERTWDGSFWRISGPLYLLSHEQNMCTAIGVNDYAGTSWANVDLNKTITVPAAARQFHCVLNLSFRTLTGLQTFDVRCKFNGVVVPNSTYTLACPDSSMAPVHWSFMVACAGLTTPALQIEAQRTAGSSSHRQNASHYSLQWWFD